MIATAENALSDTALGRRAIDAAERVSESGGDPRWQQLAPYLFGSFAGVFTTSLGILAAALTVATLAVFIALQPEAYLSGALHLVPRARRERLRAVLTAWARDLLRRAPP